MRRAAQPRRWLPCLAFAAGVALLGTDKASAQPVIEGIVQAADSAVTTAPLDRAGVVWQREIETDRASNFFRLRFTDIAASGGVDFLVRVKNRGNQTILEVPGSAFAKAPHYWTGYLPGTYALVEIENRGAAPGARVSFKLAEIAVEAPSGAKSLNLQDLLNPKDRPVAHYADNAGLIQAARSVAKLRFERKKALLACTGFLVSENLMLTNQHCFDSAEACASAVALFGYEEDRDRNLRQAEEFRCEEIKDSDPGLDFTLIRLAGAPGARWGVLPWDLAAPRKGTALYVVQHPGGMPKRVALEGCAVTKQDAVGGVAGQATDLGHTCDTENGSSGAPVLNLRNQVVGLHHLGFSQNDPEWKEQNRAVKAAHVHARVSRFIK